MSEGTPIGRTDDPDAVEVRGRSSADADRADAYTSGLDDSSGEPESSSADADRAEGFAARPLDDQVDRDVDEADDVIERLSSER